MDELASIFEIAACFVRVLPNDICPPFVNTVIAEELCLDWESHSGVAVTVSIQARDCVAYAVHAGDTTQYGEVAFDGTTIPAELLAAIRCASTPSRAAQLAEVMVEALDLDLPGSVVAPAIG